MRLGAHPHGPPGGAVAGQFRGVGRAPWWKEKRPPTPTGLGGQCPVGLSWKRSLSSRIQCHQEILTQVTFKINETDSLPSRLLFQASLTDSLLKRAKLFFLP